jgi:hypothetical protein
VASTSKQDAGTKRVLRHRARRLRVVVASSDLFIVVFVFVGVVEVNQGEFVCAMVDIRSADYN